MFSQNKISVEFKKSVLLDAENFVGVNMFNDLYYVKDNTLFKQSGENEFVYKNIQLGSIANVSIINMLQTSVFHKDFNTYVQLDRKLGQLTVHEFNTSLELSAVTYAAMTSNKRLWVFNSDTQQLQLYNPIQDKIEASTLPLQEPQLKFYSNYNFCWVLNTTKLMQFNVYGNLLNSYEINGYDDFTYYKGFLILKKEGELFLLSEEETTLQKIILPEIPIKDFSVTNETLYIYTGKELHSFAINLKHTK
jgi:hypothetical protein